MLGLLHRNVSCDILILSIIQICNRIAQRNLTRLNYSHPSHGRYINLTLKILQVMEIYCLYKTHSASEGFSWGFEIIILRNPTDLN